MASFYTYSVTLDIASQMYNQERFLYEFPTSLPAVYPLVGGVYYVPPDTLQIFSATLTPGLETSLSLYVWNHPGTELIIPDKSLQALPASINAPSYSATLLADIENLFVTQVASFDNQNNTINQIGSARIELAKVLSNSNVVKGKAQIIQQPVDSSYAPNGSPITLTTSGFTATTQYPGVPLQLVFNQNDFTLFEPTPSIITVKVATFKDPLVPSTNGGELLRCNSIAINYI